MNWIVFRFSDIKSLKVITEVFNQSEWHFYSIDWTVKFRRAFKMCFKVTNIWNSGETLKSIERRLYDEEIMIMNSFCNEINN